MSRKGDKQRGPGRSGNRPPETQQAEPTEAKCPKCGGTVLEPLAADVDRQRFQCAEDGCGEHFWLPIALARTVTGEKSPIDATTPPAAGALDCPKCGKPFQRKGHWREMHVANCDGKRKAAKAPGAPKPTAAAEEPVDLQDRGPSLKKRVISFIRNERDHHTAQADVARRLIDAIAEVEEAGE